ncbi:MAG: c-type cytochrome [Gemmatimonadaceae bacterium]
MTRGVRPPATSAMAVRVLLLALAVGCRDTDRMSELGAAETFAGHAERGRALMRTYGCQTCHTIPGVVGANAIVGPPLAGIAGRSYIGGVLPNTPENMLRWLQDPKAVDSLTAMPNVGVTPSDARHIAAYLYTLR